jgi:polar amino acid transport system substrate-binding protein
MARFLFLVAAVLLAWSPGPARAEPAPLRIGWFAGAPFQFEGPRGATGLDIEMVRAIAARAGHPLDFQRTSWTALMEDVAAGRRDVASGVAFTPARAAAGQLSLPYRRDVNVLVVRAGEAGRVVARDAAGLVAALRGGGFRLGAIQGFSYGDAALDAWLADPGNPQARLTPDDATNLRRLLAGEIDGFLAERIAAATLIGAHPTPRAVEEHPLRILLPMHLMFSAAVPAETVAAFNTAIAALEAEGRFARIAVQFRAPVLLGLTLNSRWFLVLEIIGTVAAALAGYLAARQGRYSLFGALVLAIVTATGGGILRDLVANRHPLGIMTSPLYLLLVLGTVLLAFALGHVARAAWLRAWLDRLPGHAARLRETLFDLADALGLAAFAVVGVAVAIGTNATPLWIWAPLLGALTGAGGGILRDIIRGGGDIPNLRTGIYGEVALFWSIVLTAWLEWRSATIEVEEIILAVSVAVLGGAATRMALRGRRAVPLP